MGSLTMANYEVEDVCDCKLSEKGTLLFKIKWLGYPAAENTWERASNLDPEALRGSALPILLSSPLVDEIQGASLMRNLRKVASHITGMTIRSMRTSMNFGYNGTRERAHLLLLFSFWGNVHPARIINLKWEDVVEDQRNGALILKVPGQNIILHRLSVSLQDSIQFQHINDSNLSSKGVKIQMKKTRKLMISTLSTFFAIQNQIKNSNDSLQHGKEHQRESVLLNLITFVLQLHVTTTSSP